MVKGFKGFNQDLTCRGFQYEIGNSMAVPVMRWIGEMIKMIKEE